MDVFFSKIEKTSKCWNWKGSTRNGYGAFKYRRKVYGAHRFSWMLFNGEIPFSKIICHKCDNKLCVNPNHLFVGTHKDNMQDMVKKGRHRSVCKFQLGRIPKNRKLTIKEAKKIRTLYKKGIKKNKLAFLYNVNEKVIYLIVNNKTYKES